MSARQDAPVWPVGSDGSQEERGDRLEEVMKMEREVKWLAKLRGGQLIEQGRGVSD